MPYPDPRLYWARTFGTHRRQVWIHGRDLIRVGGEYGSEHNARPIAFSDDIPLTLDDLRPNNGHGANRALRETLRFWLPENVPFGRIPIRLCRNDGATLEFFSIHEPISPTTIELRKSQINERGEIAETIELPPKTSLDLGGRVCRPASGFRGRELFKLNSDSSLSNGGIAIGEEDPSIYPISVSGTNIQLRDLTIRNAHSGGVGVFMGSTSASVFLRMSIQADRHFELFPGYRSESNVFMNVEMTGIRGSTDSEVGRGLGGADNLVVWCSWHDIDRGPTLQSHGAPLSRMLFFECDQFNTGHSVGASEGLLFETGGTIASVFGGTNELEVNLAHVPANKRSRILQTGNVVCTMNASKQWSRIIRTQSLGKPEDLLISLDRSVATTPPSKEPVAIYVGSAVVESTIARCRFRNGRAGVTFWGPALDCHLIDNDFEHLDYGIVHLDRMEPTIGFLWDAEYRHNVGRNITKGRIATREPLPESNNVMRID